MSKDETPRRRRRSAPEEAEEKPKRKRSRAPEPEEEELPEDESNDRLSEIDEDDFDFEADCFIDPDFLDAEWLRQPALAHKYARAESLARDELRDAKDFLEIVKAKLDAQIRNDPEGFNVIKVTNDSVFACILAQPKYIKVQKEFNQAQRKVGLIAAGRSAIDQKKSALENMVRLHGQHYFSGPSTPHDVPEVADRISELKKGSVQNSVKSALNKNK